MSEYAKKTCYDCGIRKPAPYMERVTESYESGRSNTTVTSGNLVFGALGDKRGQNAVGRAIKGNNRRTYTRNRTVWKCLDCSGHNAEVARLKTIQQAKNAGAYRWYHSEFLSETLSVVGGFSALVLLFALVTWWGFGVVWGSAFWWTTSVAAFSLLGLSGFLDESRADAIAVGKTRDAQL